MNLKGNEEITDRKKIVFHFDVVSISKNEQLENSGSQMVNMLGIIKDFHNLTIILISI